MKLTKKLLALLLAMAMLFALCACGDDKADKKDDSGKKDKEDVLTADTIVGDWKMTMDISSLLGSGAMGDDMPEMFELMDPSELDLKMIATVTFTEDGEMKMDPDDVQDFYTGMIDSILDWLKEGDNIYEMMAASSDGELTADEFKSYCDAQGLSKETLIAMVEEEIPTDNTLADEMDTIYYELDGNTLYSWSEDDEGEKEDEYMEFTYEDGVITITKVISEDETFKPEAGTFTFKKK